MGFFKKKLILIPNVVQKLKNKLLGELWKESNNLKKMV